VVIESVTVQQTGAASSSGVGSKPGTESGSESGSK
jgi:hypothetical protein